MLEKTHLELQVEVHLYHPTILTTKNPDSTSSITAVTVAFDLPVCKDHVNLQNLEEILYYKGQMLEQACLKC